MEEDTPQFITCNRIRDGERCGAEIPLVKENLRLFGKGGHQITAICPVCSKSHVQTKEFSTPLIEKYFMNEEGEVGNEDGIPVPPFDESPSSSYVNKVLEALDMFGYTKGKWATQRKIIDRLCRENPKFSTPEGLYDLLTSFKVDPRYLPLLNEIVFGCGTADDLSPIPDFSRLGGNPSMAAQPFSREYGVPMTQNSGYGGYHVQTMPNGQVIVIPPAPTSAPAPAKSRDDDDSVVVEEVLDEHGAVKKRIIKQHGKPVVAEPPQESEMDRMLKMITVMRELDNISGRNKQDSSDDGFKQIAELIGKLSEQIALTSRRSNSGGDEFASITRAQDERYQKLMDKYEDMQRSLSQRELDALRAQVQDLRDQREKAGINPALSDEKYRLEHQSRNLSTVGDHVESLGVKVLEPLIEMNKQQMKMNSMMLIRQMEATDGVAPGTYLTVMSGSSQPTDQQVQKDVEKWKRRADSARKAATQSPGEEE